MIRMNLPLAAGLLVVPLFAGWDAPAGQGRIFSYDGTGGKYEEHAFFSVGSGAVFARGSLKKLYRPDLEAGEATMAVIQALYDAADDDSDHGWSGSDAQDLSGGPARHGRRSASDQRCPDRRSGRSGDVQPDGASRRTRSSSHVSMPFYVAPEQQMKDRADFARKAPPAADRSLCLHYADGILFVAENRSQALHKVSEIYDGSLSPLSAAITSSRTCGRPASAMRTCGVTATTVPTSPAGAWPTRTRSCSARSSSGGEKPYEVEIIVAELGATS